nr:uncharacterized protein LOC129164735 [Nothobranchius furzeri]XP_054601755.1 uncharacterized protein LOC129164735 [Nothobranchius furzeri]XP_054601756.1 uncharacterized protein LOC129164735 [Nothobranchius furzeri]
MEGQSSELTNSQQPGGAAAHDYEPGLLSGQILSKLVAVAREPDYPSRDFTEEQRSDELEAVIDQIENPDGTKPIQVHLAKLALILYQRELQHDREIMNLQSMLAEKQRNGRLIEEDDTRTDSGEDGEETPPPSADDNRQWEGGKHHDSLDGRTPQGRDEAYLSQPSAPFPTHTIGHSGPPRGRGQFALEPQVGPPPSSSRPSQSVRSRPAERHLYLDRSPSPRRVQGADWGYAPQAAPQPSTHPSYSGIRHAGNQLQDKASYASPYPDRAYYAEAPVERRRLHYADVPREEDLPRHPRDVPAARHSMPNPDLGPRSQHWEPRAHQRYPAPSETDRGSESEDDAPYRESGLRVRQIESLAKDIERFDPNNNESNVDNYLREIERCLLDLPAPSSREKLKLIWKTTSRTVHGFMETLPPDIRDRYSSLCRALRDEYATYADSASATMGAFSIKHGRNEPPREYYRRLKSAYFQGRNGPGLEEDPAFRSLFIHNLHECVRSEVSMYCRMKKLTTQEIRRYAQQAWEAGGKPQKPDAHHRVMHLAPNAEPRLELEGTEAPPTKPKSAKPRPVKPREQSQSPQQGKGGADWPPRSGQSDRKWPNQNQRQAGRNSGRFKERRPQVSPERKSAGEYLTKADLQEMFQQFLAKQKEQLRSADETPAPKSASKKPDPEPTSA